MLRKVLPIVLSLPLVACVKDRTQPQGVAEPGGRAIVPGILLVNEFVARGSQDVNEFGSAEDWFEIYNPGNEEVYLAPGRWFVSDAGPSDPTKYELPEWTIPAHGHLVVWCDNQNVLGRAIHTNFALSADAEHLVIYYDDGVTAFVVDDHLYGPQNVAGASEGRSPDGSENWVRFTKTTPGSAQQTWLAPDQGR